MTARADLVEELINDTIVEVWKDGALIGANATVLLGIMRLAYSRVQKHFAEARPDKPHSRKDERDKDLSKSLLTTDPPSNLRCFRACTRNRFWGVIG